jgi:hypothetical protein
MQSPIKPSMAGALLAWVNPCPSGPSSHTRSEARNFVYASVSAGLKTRSPGLKSGAHQANRSALERTEFAAKSQPCG